MGWGDRDFIGRIFGWTGTKENPYHEPAGTPQGGQFANAPGGGEKKMNRNEMYETLRGKLAALRSAGLHAGGINQAQQVAISDLASRAANLLPGSPASDAKAQRVYDELMAELAAAEAWTGEGGPFLRYQNGKFVS